MDDSEWPEVLILIASLLVTALLARLDSIGSALSRSTLERLRDEGDPRARLLLSIYRPRDVLGQMAIFGQTVVIAIGCVAAVNLTASFPYPIPWPILRSVFAVAFFVLISLCISNIIPPYRREEASDSPLPRLLLVCYPLYLLLLLPTLLLQRTRNLFVSETDTRAIKEEGLRQIVQSGTEEGTIEAEERDMIEGIFEFGDTTVKEVMVPRIDMVCAEISMPPKDFLALVQKTRHSRIPIYRERVDHIEGVVYVKDLLSILSTGQDWEIARIMRDSYFVPENKNIDELLREFKNAKVHIAIVVDEYGGVSGIATIEDLLEEIVGEIIDEFDTESAEPKVLPIGADAFMVDASVGIDQLNELWSVSFEGEGFDTLGGFVYQRLGKIPSLGDSVEYDGLKIEVVSTAGRRLKRLRVTRTGNGGEAVG